jgi:hypothetical protein
MGHYWSEVRDDPTDLEILQWKTNEVVKKLRKLPASAFSIDELGMLLKTNWSRWKENYYEVECKEILKIAEREGVKI